MQLSILVLFTIAALFAATADASVFDHRVFAELVTPAPATPPPPTPAPATPAPSTDAPTSSKGPIVGGIIGAVVGLLIVGGVAYYCIKVRGSDQGTGQHAPLTQPMLTPPPKSHQPHQGSHQHDAEAML